MSYFDRKPWMRAPFRFALIALGALGLFCVILCRPGNPSPSLFFLPAFAILMLNAVFVIPVARKLKK